MIGPLLVSALLAGVPDVILVTIDTLRADHVGAYGAPRGATPFMDRLALAGVVAEEAVVQVPLTRPSHASLLTGLLPFQHGIRDNASPPLPRDVPTLASVFKAAGYATGAFIGAYPVSRASGLDRGFDVYDDPFVAESDPRAGQVDRNERPAREVVDAALAWARATTGRPRFLWLHFFEPHYPYEPPPPIAARFSGAAYDGEIATADAELGRLLRALPAGGDRLVVVTADHGEGLGEHSEDEHHLFVYDSTLRVPLVMAGADLPPGRRLRGQFRSIDLMPTLLELAGVKAPAVTGASRAANFRSGALIPDNDSYAETLYGSIHFGYAPVRALRSEGFKFIDTPRVELYRVASDKGEITNLAPARAPLAAAMQKRLRALHGEDARARAAAPKVDAATQERLSSLGYVAGGASGPETAPNGPAPDPKDRVLAYRRYSTAVNAALASRRRGDPAGVARALLPVSREFSEQPSVATFLGEALLETRRFDEAVPWLRKAADTSPSAWRRWARLAEALSALGKNADALVALDRGLAAAPRATDLLRLKAAALVRGGRPQDAASLLEKASAADPGNALLLGELASLRRNAGDLAGAEAASARAVAVGPREADAWLSRGLALGALGRLDEAGAAFERAAELDPRSADARFYAATVRVQKGDKTRALELLRDARRLDPARPGLAEVEAAARAATSLPSTSASRAPAGAGTVRLLIIKATTRAEAEALRARLARGEDLKALEQDLGAVRPGDLRPPLNAAAAALMPGAMSPVLETRDGFVILRRPR